MNESLGSFISIRRIVYGSPLLRLDPDLTHGRITSIAVQCPRLASVSPSLPWPHAGSQSSPDQARFILD